MGEIAEMILEGTLCNQCGKAINEGEAGPGYPISCEGCLQEYQKKQEGREPKKESFGKIKVMGIHVNDRREKIDKYVHFGSKFILTRERENQFDQNAILIELFCKNGKSKIDLGYVPREKAAEIAPLIDSGVNIKATFRTKIINEKTGKFIDLYLNLTQAN